MAESRTDRAHALYVKTFRGSTIKDRSNEYPKFDFDELSLGKTLGEGGFGIVSEILAFDVSKDAVVGDDGANDGANDQQVNQDELEVGLEQRKDIEKDGGQAMEMQGRKFIADHCIRDGQDARYAIKILKRELHNNEKLLTKALADMVVESHILSAIEHPNIVKIRATSLQPRYDVSYFIVMDRLYDTLEKRLTVWVEKAGKPQTRKETALTSQTPQAPASISKAKRGFLARCFERESSVEISAHSQQSEGSKGSVDDIAPLPSDPKNIDDKTANKLLEERLVVAFDLASALAYLHSRRIVYRDMKPENCAFDVRGDIKLFDFGTSKELPHQNAERDQTFKLTGLTGSLPYMAPEVVNSNLYNHKCDVFSFSVMLWEMMALETPFAEYESDLHRMWEEVHNFPHIRPKIPHNKWPKSIELCLKRGWSETLSERMEMGQIEEIVKQEIVRVRNGDASGLRHDRRRSTFVFRRR